MTRCWPGSGPTGHRRQAVVYLLLAVLSSCMISILMRLSTEKVSSRLSMLCMNYVVCTLLGRCMPGSPQT